jgi:LysM repeat protein
MPVVAQTELLDDTLQNDSAVVEKILLVVPEFKLIDEDTIALGEHDELIYDHYTARGMPHVYDALHSFNFRRMDRFGGYLNVKVNDGLERIRKKGFNSDVKKLYIQIDPLTLSVYWFAVVGPSEDGNCYTKIDSRGSAGGGIRQVEKQLPRMHSLYPTLKAVKFMEFNENVIVCFDNSGNPLPEYTYTVNILQHFYKYKDLAYTAKPSDQISAQDSVLVNTSITPPNEVSKSPFNEITPTKKVIKPAYTVYKVKNGDTLSEIAEKYHMSVSKIKKFNGLKSDTIRAGQTLKIPK